MPQPVRSVTKWRGLCARRVPGLHAALVVATMLVGPVLHAQTTDHPGALFEMPLPGGLRAALATIDDRVPPDRSQFLLEFIRRSYNTPVVVNNDRRAAVLQLLLAHLDAHGQTLSGLSGAPETLPLPMPPKVWLDVVFGGRALPQSLATEILRSRNAALLYYGLLSLDDDTRAWLATERELLTYLTAQSPGAFVAAAPGLRVAQNAVRLPGGEAAEPAWEALVGRRPKEPAEFVRALVAQGEGRLAYFFGTIAQLTPAQIRLALNLDSPDAAARIAASRRLHAVFERLAATWKIEDRTFSRPALDPALLIADLRTDDGGRPVVPGTRGFWTMVLAASAPRRSETDNAPRGFPASPDSEPVDFAWLCEQIFKGDRLDQRRYQLVLFASRVIGRVTPETMRDAVDAVRAAGDYPALVTVLERAQLTDVSAFARAARRASQLMAIDDDTRAARALAQFQGALALITRATLRGSLPTSSLPKYVISLSEVELSEHGEYEGRLVSWLDTLLRADDKLLKAPGAAGAMEGLLNDFQARSAGPLERELLDLLAGPSSSQPRLVNWEGTRYRVDLARAEALRLARLLGENPRPYVSSARAITVLADALAKRVPTSAERRQHADALEQLANTVMSDGPEKWEGLSTPDRYRKAAATLRVSDIAGAARLVPTLRLLADDLLAHGLMELVYATALGQPDRTTVSAADAASRHDFGLKEPGANPNIVWGLPVARFDRLRDWHVTGSLLGLDVRLAEFSLTPLSSKPPSTKPTLNDGDRRLMIEAVSLVQSTWLDDADRDTIVAAIRKGRSRLAAVRTSAEATALADEIRLSPARRSLLAWVVTRDPQRAAVFLSPIELLWLGLETTSGDSARLHAWGAPGEPRLGCLCVQLTARRPWETLAGRWHSGILATGFADLNLRLAELLSELKMPAPLLAPVLASATLDLINDAISRDLDDRRGLVEFVHALPIDRAEQYLALLTTNGPLVPLGEASEPTAAVLMGVPPGGSR
jgi:hypothetical protein